MTDTLSTIVTILAPLYEATVAILAPVAAGWLILQFRKKTGVQLDAAARETLQSAITNAATRAVAMSGGAVAASAVTDAALAAGARLVKEGAGEAVERFGLSEETIRARIQDQALAAILAVPTGGPRR